MPQITISASAIKKITSDPNFRQLREDKTNPQVPLLYYYQRSYSTSHDGAIVEYGDGFMLSFISQDEIRAATADIIYETVTIANGVNILVGGPRSILSGDIDIGWSDAKFFLEPHMPS